MELWFKLMLHDLQRTIDAIDDSEWTAAIVLMRRLSDVLDSVTAQMRSLQDMPPWSFHEFRSYLGTASGLQSIQFRELELLSGLRDAAYLHGLQASYDGFLPEPLRRRSTQRSLREAHLGAAERTGIVEWADFYADTGVRSPFYLLCEALLDYDERWTRWRTDHVILVERTLGARARGTGGTALSYLQRTARYRLFDYLWDARNDLSVRGGGEVVPLTPWPRDPR